MFDSSLSTYTGSLVSRFEAWSQPKASKSLIERLRPDRLMGMTANFACASTESILNGLRFIVLLAPLVVKKAAELLAIQRVSQVLAVVTWELVRNSGYKAVTLGVHAVIGSVLAVLAPEKCVRFYDDLGLERVKPGILPALIAPIPFPNVTSADIKKLCMQAYDTAREVGRQAYAFAVQHPRLTKIAAGTVGLIALGALAPRSERRQVAYAAPAGTEGSGQPFFSGFGMPGMPNMPGMPGMPGMPSFAMPGMPAMPGVPTMPWPVFPPMSTPGTGFPGAAAGAGAPGAAAAAGAGLAAGAAAGAAAATETVAAAVPAAPAAVADATLAEAASNATAGATNGSGVSDIDFGTTPWDKPWAAMSWDIDPAELREGECPVFSWEALKKHFFQLAKQGFQDLARATRREMTWWNAWQAIKVNALLVLALRADRTPLIKLWRRMWCGRTDDKKFMALLEAVREMNAGIARQKNEHERPEIDFKELRSLVKRANKFPTDPGRKEWTDFAYERRILNDNYRIELERSGTCFKRLRNRCRRVSPPAKQSSPPPANPSATQSR